MNRLEATWAEHPMNPVVLYHRVGDPLISRTDFDNNFEKYCILDMNKSNP